MIPNYLVHLLCESSTMWWLMTAELTVHLRVSFSFLFATGMNGFSNNIQQRPTRLKEIIEPAPQGIHCQWLDEF